MSAELITVEVAYATPAKQKIFVLEVPAGTSALQAAQQASIPEFFPEADMSAPKLGIFGKSVKPTHVLRAGDRVEVYRPLIADPKQSRKKRASAQ